MCLACSITIESLENTRTHENKQGLQFLGGDHLTGERDAQMPSIHILMFLLRRSCEEVATHLHIYLEGDGHKIPFLGIDNQLFIFLPIKVFLSIYFMRGQGRHSHSPNTHLSWDDHETFYLGNDNHLFIFTLTYCEQNDNLSGRI